MKVTCDNKQCPYYNKCSKVWQDDQTQSYLYCKFYQ